MTQSSAAIPIVPLYLSILLKVMKEKNLHEDCIQQMYRLVHDRLCNHSGVPVDDMRLIRMDDYEMKPEVQQAVEKVWNEISQDNLAEVADIDEYWKEFYEIFGFKIAGVDYEAYGMDMFKAGTSLDEFSIEEIVNMDFKEFNMSGNRVGIGQVMTLDIDSILNKKDEYLSYINGTDYDMLVLAITDIIKEGSYLLYKANDSVISEAFNVDANQGVFAEGVVSRKKQLVPNLTSAVKNM